MRTVSVSEAKNQLSALLDRVKAGEEALILERGVPVARLSPVAGGSGEGLALLERKGLVRRGLGQPVNLEALPWPEAKASTLELLLREREEGR
ncbi:type II toxin-antitoxin system Phd/YefM family antitoxin [Meiothermus rufus]|uniref:type II toxin-antitoxin system Phd/YefM family antitoxin n=1 Tax=Meiothermus rufus TaxID=604332 RepID=UPI00040C2153|nr:type II toxin-antitoxin system prevent-host-death family antitoxin [Meiothermus rufus]